MRRKSSVSVRMGCPNRLPRVRAAAGPSRSTKSNDNLSALGGEAEWGSGTYGNLGEGIETVDQKALYETCVRMRVNQVSDRNLSFLGYCI